MNIQVEAFKKERDLPLMTEWRKNWGESDVGDAGISTTGFIAYEIDMQHRYRPLMIAFLMLTNSKTALIETVTANPNTHWSEREEALKALIGAIERHAKELGFKRLVGFTDHRRLADKSTVAGWSVSPNRFWAAGKEIK